MENKNKKIINRDGRCYRRQPVFSRTENSFSEKKVSVSFGFINIKVILIFLLAATGCVYLSFVNGSAVKGYQIKSIEKEISDLQKENERLKINEAELNSLQHIEEESKNLINMSESSQQLVYIEESGPVALK
ncbi:MAG: Uncharacterized protein Athens101428_126 [Candidatus Berkelbacteria bacterium Athens1014_28]|uniref:Cell division protein FtsL n=1 Tax=Candidatus Berkelbacteria bacterium Athens1014_28 TaxID=2017145 RepID=A0A554LPX8_9BACT|nr:MAG: Uncharacterized protein Athens101428_126 [Candidatus Berkelbacteria bacterium Athens1014_28]